jgi:hypothetical protein
MSTTAVGPQDDERLQLAVTVADCTDLHDVAAELDCAASAIVRLLPFIVDGALIGVLASAMMSVRAADLVVALRAGVVRRPRAEEILLGVQLGLPMRTIFIDRALLDREQMLCCVDPPCGYVTSSAAALRAALDAQPISLPTRYAS